MSTPTAHIAEARQHPPARAAPARRRGPAGEVWVHCAGGYRASIAASVLDAAGRRVVAVDDSFGDHAAAADLPIATAA